MIQIRMRPLILALLLSFLATASAEGGVEKIEGYGGYRFGMDLNEADAVAEEDVVGPCPYPGVYMCLTRPLTLYGEAARLVVQIDDTSRRVKQILVEFDRVRDENTQSECDRTANNVLEELLKQYDHPDTVDQREAVWMGRQGGLLSFVSFCVNRHKGMVSVTYKESGRL